MYHIRPFQLSDLEAYRDMRLEALKTEPGNFGNSHALESALSEAEWVDRIINPLGCRFGLYEENQLIGITGIIADKDNPEEAYMNQSYIRKPYRGKRLSRLLYEARINWAKAQGIRRLEIGHRAGNIISKAANRHFGFTYTHTVSRTWPDGATEDMFYYELYI